MCKSKIEGRKFRSRIEAYIAIRRSGANPSLIPINGSAPMIVETSRPSRASRLRRSRPAWLPLLAVVMVIIGIGTAALIVTHH
jgi:hypothetical protein